MGAAHPTGVNVGRERGRAVRGGSSPRENTFEILGWAIRVAHRFGLTLGRQFGIGVGMNHYYFALFVDVCPSTPRLKPRGGYWGLFGSGERSMKSDENYSISVRGAKGCPISSGIGVWHG